MRVVCDLTEWEAPRRGFLFSSRPPESFFVLGPFMFLWRRKESNNAKPL